MYCKNCGTQVADDMIFCPVCGKPVVELASTNQQNPYASASYYQPQQQYYYPPPRPGSGFATASLVCGIVGLCIYIFGLILGTIAVVMSVKAKRLGFIGGKATAGLVCGIIGIVLGAVALLSLLSVFSMR